MKNLIFYLEVTPPETVHIVMLYSLPGTRSTKVTFRSGSCAAFSIIGMVGSVSWNLLKKTKP